MDMENKALKEAFDKKYGVLDPENRKKMGITPEDWEKTKQNFAKKFYGEEPKKEEESFIEKAKRLGKAAIDVNVGRATGDTKKMMGGYKYLEGK